MKNTNSAWSGASKEACEQVANMLLNDISGPAGEKTEDRDKTDAVSKLNKYFFSVADDNAAADMKNVFSGIAQSILEAAKDVSVTDKIADKYTMVFDFPNLEVKNDYEASLGEGQTPQDFYIELNEYQLNAVYDQGDDSKHIVDYTRGTSKSLFKLYLGTESGKYIAAKDAVGTKFEAPVFAAKPSGTKYYWSTDSSKADAKVPVTVTQNGTTYYFVPSGKGEFNMVSGAYANGTVTTETVGGESVNMPSQDIVIATPYFVYDAATRMLVWTTEKLSTTELALTYFLYLNNSGGFVGTTAEVDADTYPTNDYALLNYTNFQESECEQVFPIPQMTWNGAQVSYVFYLVNDDGVPVNRAGRRIPFSEAVYVTDIYTYSKIWNKNDVDGQLTANYLAKDIVPEVYELFDKNNHFIIDGNAGLVETTYVFNTKADVEKYTELGTYDKGDVHTGFDFSNTTVDFAVVWKPELRDDVVVIDYGLPVDIDVAKNDNVDGIVEGVSDDYDLGLLDTAINKGQIVNYRVRPTEIAPGKYNAIKYGSAEVVNATTVRYTPLTMNWNQDGGLDDDTNPDNDTKERFYYITRLNYYDKSNQLITSYMYSSVTVVPATNIYYEDTATFVDYVPGVTDITTENPEGTKVKWETLGDTTKLVTQAQDRPGKSDISASIDKDNLYGYDDAYSSSATYSLGSAHKITVSAKQNPKNGGQWPTASFTFTGTGFDILSVTSSQTGVITVKVENTDKSYSKNWIVDTYYGYTYTANSENQFLKHKLVYGTDNQWHLVDTVEVNSKDLAAGESTVVPATPKVGDSVVTFANNGVWTATQDTENALYQIPVIKSPELTYDTYTVTITPTYGKAFNHLEDASYDFYLDGVRIYNPAVLSSVVSTGKDLDSTDDDVTIGDIYVKDGEGYPVYAEIRKNLLNQKAFDTDADSVTGAVFIDGFGTNGTISNYEAYGPNNEVYLNPGQAVAFSIENASAANYVAAHLGVKTPNKTAEQNAEVTVTNGTTTKKVTTGSAAERYYNISDCVKFTGAESNVIIITNTGSAMVSLTNVKLTHKAPTVSAAVEFRITKNSAEYASRVVYEQCVNGIEKEVKTPIPVSSLVTNVFEDIQEGWYTEYVQFVYSNKLMVGNGDLFTPDNTLTRAMVVTTLYRMAGSPTVEDTAACKDLKDVKSNKWYTNAICWAYSEGITTGYTGTDLFGVNDPVTREQLATFFYRYAKKYALDISQESDLSGFENSDKVSGYAKEAVSWMIGTGVIRGVEKVENGNNIYDLAPAQNATRAQMAAILARFCEFYDL